MAEGRNARIFVKNSHKSVAQTEMRFFVTFPLSYMEIKTKMVVSTKSRTKVLTDVLSIVAFGCDLI